MAGVHGCHGRSRLRAAARPTKLYFGGYSPELLERWASVIRDLGTRGDRAEAPRDVYVYFDNDADGRAPFDALALADTLAG